MLIADVDGFKEINDTRGHAAGDAVLRTMAAVMRSAAPAGGRAFPIGGDEFALVFECEGAEAAEQVVARADDALYAVKRLGRDGVRLAPQR